MTKDVGRELSSKKPLIFPRHVSRSFSAVQGISSDCIDSAAQALDRELHLFSRYGIEVFPFPLQSVKQAAYARGKRLSGIAIRIHGCTSQRSGVG